MQKDFREFSLQIPAVSIQHDHNYYLVMMIKTYGILTHVSKSLLISKFQTPPLVIDLPVHSLDLISGFIYNIENHPARWSSSSVAKLLLIDDSPENLDQSAIQMWQIRL